MCDSNKVKATTIAGFESSSTTSTEGQIMGRAVLQPSNSLSVVKKLASPNNNSDQTEYARPPAAAASFLSKQQQQLGANNLHDMQNLSSDKAISYGSGTTARSASRGLDRNKSKSFNHKLLQGGSTNAEHHHLEYPLIGINCWSSTSTSLDLYQTTGTAALITEAPGSIATVRREQVALQQAQRKMRIAHYGRSKSARFDHKVFPITDSCTSTPHLQEQRRCSFITPNSDPVYIAYHDEEWGVPVHEDKILFELLVISAAQVGSDWTCILKKRPHLRNAFSGFDAQAVANFNDRLIMSISSQVGMDINRVREVVDNSKRILEIKKEFGSFDKYIWGFVSNKPICSQHKSGHKIPVKTSKSESISKDMVRRGFRFVGPTVVHSFMQAVGLINDHLITCHRHLQCTSF